MTNSAMVVGGTVHPLLPSHPHFFSPANPGNWSSNLSVTSPLLWPRGPWCSRLSANQGKIPNVTWLSEVIQPKADCWDRLWRFQWEFVHVMDWCLTIFANLNYFYIWPTKIKFMDFQDCPVSSGSTICLLLICSAILLYWSLHKLVVLCLDNKKSTYIVSGSKVAVCWFVLFTTVVFDFHSLWDKRALSRSTCINVHRPMARKSWFH